MGLQKTSKNYTSKNTINKEKKTMMVDEGVGVGKCVKNVSKCTTYKIDYYRLLPITNTYRLLPIK